ncbi:MAG TPA: hypothetical protein DCE41_11790, partial [Cytophagales bacterium]|nr:hypothetical protein [Cytophagales bacterium]
RNVAQTKVDGNVEQLGTGIAGILLLLFTWQFDANEGRLKLFALLSLPLFLAWAYLAFKLYQAYRKQLSSVLEVTGTASTKSSDDLMLALPPACQSPTWQAIVAVEIPLPNPDPGHASTYYLLPGAKLRRRLQESLENQPGEVPEIMLALARQQEITAVPALIDLLQQGRYAHAAIAVLPLYRDRVLM